MSLPRYPGYMDSGVRWIAEVPSHWQVCAAKRWILSRAGGTLIKGECASEPGDGLFPAFSASGQDVWVEQPTYLEPGIVLSAVGARCGKTFKADGQWGVVANTHCLFPMRGASRDFIWYLTNQEDWWERGGTAQPFIKVSETLARNWAFPPPIEQSAIAAFLDRETAKIDALIAEQEKLIALLAEKRQATISHAVTKGLNPDAPMKDSGVPWLGEVPGHWEINRLKSISPQITVGIVVEPSKYYVDSGVPALRSLNVAPGRVVEDNFVFISVESNELLSKSRLRAGDLVSVRSGQTGTTAVVPESLDGCNCIDLIIIRKPRDDSEQFLCWFLGSDAAIQQFSSGSGGAIQQHFNIGTAMNLQIPLPPREEQDAIVKFLEAESAKIESLHRASEQSIDLLQERRSALIAAAVTGQIDLRGIY